MQSQFLWRSVSLHTKNSEELITPNSLLYIQTVGVHRRKSIFSFMVE